MYSMNMGELLATYDLSDLLTGAVYLLAVTIQLYYLLGIQLKLGLHRPGKPADPVRVKDNPGGISVVICARNEQENLRRFLPGILEQDYPDFEVVVVNDASTDDSAELLNDLARKYSRLRITSIPLNDKFRHGKKLALTIGLKAARFDRVLLTDADCYPESDRWIGNMASHLEGGKQIVLGYGAYEYRKGLLNRLIRYETVAAAMMFLSRALKGRPYMGVGRNLGYDKTLYFSSEGFRNHYHIPSGDDDLFVNAVATGENTAVELNRSSFTRSLPPESAGAWIRQKKRHVTAGIHYKKTTRFILAADWVSRLMLYAGLILLISLTPWKWVAALVFLIYTGVRMVVLKLGMRRLDEKYLLLPSLLFDPVLPLFLGIIWLSNLLDSKYQVWN